MMKKEAKNKDRKNMIRDSWKEYSRVSRLKRDSDNEGFSLLETFQPRFTSFGNFLDGNINPLWVNPFRKWFDYNTRQEFTIPYLPETIRLSKDNPSNSSTETVENKTREGMSIVFWENRPRGKELQEIVDSTLVYINTLTKDEKYKAMKEHFNKTASLYHIAAIEFERYRVIRTAIEDSGKVMKLQSIPIYRERPMDKISTRYAEKRNREYQKENDKKDVQESKSLSLIETILKAKGISLEEIRRMK